MKAKIIALLLLFLFVSVARPVYIEPLVDRKTATFVIAASNSLHKTDADYVCDGTDDDVQIQAAIDAATNGGKVTLLEGTFTIGSPIEVYGGITLEGQGMGQLSNERNTTIWLANSANCNMIEFVGRSAGHAYFGAIKNLYLYGNKTNQTGTIACININNCSDVVMENIFISGGKYYGIYVRAGCWNIFAHNLWVEDCEGEGILLVSVEGAFFDRIFIAQIHKDGIQIKTNTHHCTFSNMRFKLNKRRGLYILDGSGHNPSYLTFNNILFQDCSDLTPGAMPALHIKTSEQECHYTFNNVIFSSDQHQYDVQIEKGTDDTNYSDYIFFNNTSFTSAGVSLEDGCNLHGNFGNSYGKVGFDQKVVKFKNTSGGTLAIGDVIVLKSVADGNECTTTTSQGDDKVLGMAVESIANNGAGGILLEGRTIVLKVNGTVDIAIGDFLGTFTTAKIARKAAAGDMAFAIALEAYTTDDSSGVIDAMLIKPRKIVATADVMYPVKTVVKTIDVDDDASTDDFQFDDDVADQAEQPVDLGAIIPAYAEVLSAQIRCFETVTGSAVMSIDLGTASGGAEVLATANTDSANDINGTGVGDGPEILAANAAKHIWINATPGADWNTLDAGRWAVMITYIDYGAVYTWKNP